MRNKTAIGWLACAVALSACSGKGGDGSLGATSSRLTVVAPPPPWVLQTNPGNGNASVPVNTAIFALYSGPLNPATLTTSTLTLTTSAGAAVSGTVGYDAATNKASFVPDAPLAANTRYTARVLAGVTDASGNSVAASSWSFTAARPSTSPPTFGSLSVSTNAPLAPTIVLPFTSAVDPATITAANLTLTDATPAAVAATVFYDAPTNSAVLVPSAALAPGATYAVTATTGITSAAGVPLTANRTFTFTTTTGADVTAPAILMAAPASGAAGVALDGAFSVVFTEAVDGSSVDATAFTVTDLAGAVSYDPATNRATFTPSQALTRGVTYVATVSGVEDAAGNVMAPFSWSFTAASLYSGLISDIWTDNDGHVITTQNAWAGTRSDRGVRLRWDVSPVGGAWQYQYTLHGNDKGVNKWVQDIYIGTPQGFETADLLPGWSFLEPVNGAMAQVGVVPTTPAQAWSALSSLSTTPLGISGIHWLATNNSTRGNAGPMFVLTFRTPRAPVWGDVLLDSGTPAGCGQGTCAFPIAANAGFGVAVDGTVAPANGNRGGWVLVPGPIQAAGAGPMVTAVHPATNQSNVGIASRITVTFSASMDPSTLTASTFQVSDASGAVTYDDATRTATFTPSVPLLPAMPYAVRLSPSIADAAGHPLAAPWTWSFTTEGASAVPTVLSMTPANGASGVPVTAKVTATFTEDMDETTLTTATFGVSGIPGTVSYDAASRTATFTPSSALSPGFTYAPAITTGARTAAGQALGTLTTWVFTTEGVASDPTDTAPAVTSTTPVDGATSVPVNTVITATFSEGVDPATVATSTFTVNGVAGSVSYDASSKTATFTPSAALSNGATYTATITPGVRNAGGDSLAAPKTWSFTTEPPPAPKPGSGCTSGGLGGAGSLLAVGLSALLRRRRG